MHLTCPIRQGRGVDGYGTEASKLGANPAYSTAHAETEPVYLIDHTKYARSLPTVDIFAFCSYYGPVENLYFGTGLGGDKSGCLNTSP